MKIIPLAAVPAQTFNIVLAGQNCTISVFQKSNDVFVDLAVSNRPIVSGALCVDRVQIVRHAHLGFVGEIIFADLQGSSNPDYLGFGTRYRLVYLETTDL